MQLKLSRVPRLVAISVQLYGAAYASCPSAPVPAAQDYWLSNFQSSDNAIHSGNGYSDYVDSGSLAWNEAYVLESYMEMYRSYHDLGCLDKVVAQFDKILSHMGTLNSPYGWYSSSYSAEKTQNGAFATYANSNPLDPTGWTRSHSTAATAYRSTQPGDFNPDPKLNDVAGLVLKTNPGAGPQIIEQVISSYQPGQPYTLSLYGRTNGLVSGRAEVFDATTNATIQEVDFNASTWAFYRGVFLTPNAGHTLKIRCYVSQFDVADGIAWLDNVSLRLVQAYEVHDGMILRPIADFISAVNGDQSLAAGSIYKTKAQEYLTTITQSLLPRWDTFWTSVPFTTDEGVYVVPNDEYSGSPGAFPAGSSLPHNQYLVMVSLLNELASVASNPFSAAYASRASAMGAAFKSQLRQNGSVPGAYLWNYADQLLPGDPSRRSSHPEDSAHANLDISAAVDLYHSGRVAASDMQAFASTFIQAMWNQSLSAPTVGSWVDGARVDPGTAFDKAYGVTDSIQDWLRLSEIDSRVWQIGQQIYTEVLKAGRASSYQLLAVARLAEWNPERLLNRDFRYVDPSDPTLPAYWTRWQSAAWIAYRSTNPGDTYHGPAALVIKTEPTLGWQVMQQGWDDYESSAAYTLSFTAKTNGLAGAEVDVLDMTTHQLLGWKIVSSTAWQSGSFSFQAPAQATDIIKIRCHPSRYDVPGGVAYFDGLQITKRVPAP